MPLRLVGGPEEAAAQLIAHLQCKGILNNKGNVVGPEDGVQRILRRFEEGSKRLASKPSLYSQADMGGSSA